MTKQTHFYLRDRNGHPIGVVAMRKEADGVRVAASLCAATDEWDKHVGVAKAVGRLESKSQSALLIDYVPVMGVVYSMIGHYCPQRQWWTTTRLRDVDEDHADATFASQYERLTTPRPA